MQAVRKQATLPHIIARTTIWASSGFLDGARAPKPPNVMPIEPKLANPHRAYVAIISDLSWKDSEMKRLVKYMYIETYSSVGLWTIFGNTAP